VTSGGSSSTRHLTGDEQYTQTDVANDQNGGFTRDLTAGDDYTLTIDGATTSAARTLAYAETGNYVDGKLTVTQNGQHRYELLWGFAQTANTAVAGPGMLDFSPVGAPLFVGLGVTPPTGGSSYPAGRQAHDAIFAEAAGASGSLSRGAVRGLEAAGRIEASSGAAVEVQGELARSLPHLVGRAGEKNVRPEVAACRAVQACGLPVAGVTRRLRLSERTVRRWRHSRPAQPLPRRGRRPRCASRQQRNAVYHFLRQRGTSTPLIAVQAAFPQLRRADLRDVVQRFRRAQHRKAQRYRSRLEWRRPGAVWAADFAQRREPIEGRYGWLFSVKDRPAAISWSGNRWQRLRGKSCG